MAEPRDNISCYARKQGNGKKLMGIYQKNTGQIWDDINIKNITDGSGLKHYSVQAAVTKSHKVGSF